ncbi:tetratricopeptide repeat-containing sensor histidine kinase [Tenacibaculum amylolyticum]|uniref:tetratricopeptide repeat-containing sensor histidine kinase n=1 Tax=Tenacibaculum amylolyticum TaxID=104269 RepID=UPI0038B63C31
MSYIKARFKDYYGSEILVIKAIKIFKEHEKLYECYNRLGLLQKDIKEYDKALIYYNKALVHFNKIKSKRKRDNPLYINIANIYVKKGEYSKALKYYNIALNQNIKRSRYARILDNRAYCKLLMHDTTDIQKDFFYALKIRDSLKNKAGISISKIRISDYFSYAKDTIKALQYAKEANSLAKELKNGRDYLVSLQQLANLDTKNSKKYYDRYIQFNDSLISQERRTQNKFTRIEFETDEHIADNKRLNEQRIWIFAASIALLLILSLLYYVRVQKVQNEKLQLEAEQQKANEEVYVLTLQQQAKLEEERINERNRISAELHDGILGKLFGTRVSLGFLGMQMQPETQEQHQTFLDELQTIEKEIREVSHRLSENFDDATVNFSTIIEQLLKDKSVIGNFTYTFTPDPTILWKSINEVIKANVYRIIQEALQNIIKHANAKSVILDFSLHQEQVIIKIQDDGVGFDAKKGKKGIGIKNIKTRVEKLSGSVDFISVINKGTTLLIYIPYFPQNAA